MLSPPNDRPKTTTYLRRFAHWRYHVDIVDRTGTATVTGLRRIVDSVDIGFVVPLQEDSRCRGGWKVEAANARQQTYIAETQAIEGACAIEG